MSVATESATVYRGGGRRYFTKRAAVMAEARAKLKDRCDCDYCDHPEMPGCPTEHLPCRYHDGSERAEKILRRLTRIYMTDLSIKAGGLNAVYEGGAAQLLAEQFGQQFEGAGANNYLEVCFTTKSGLRLLVTLQRCDGKTPSQFQREAEAKLADALATPPAHPAPTPTAEVPAGEVIALVVDNANGKWAALVPGAVVSGGDRLYKHPATKAITEPNSAMLILQDEPAPSLSMFATMDDYKQAKAEQAKGQQQAGVPDGWQVVPKEPTEAMHAAAVRAIIKCTGNDDFPPRVWSAMIAAAPSAPEATP